MKNVFLILLTLISSGELMAHNEPVNQFEISTKLVYPQEAIDNKEEGVVYLSFEVDTNNNVVNTIIELGVSQSLNKAALSFVQNLAKEDLQKLNLAPGERLVLPVKFSLL